MSNIIFNNLSNALSTTFPLKSLIWHGYCFCWVFHDTLIEKHDDGPSSFMKRLFADLFYICIANPQPSSPWYFGLFQIPHLPKVNTVLAFTPIRTIFCNFQGSEWLFLCGQRRGGFPPNTDEMTRRMSKPVVKNRRFELIYYLLSCSRWDRFFGWDWCEHIFYPASLFPHTVRDKSCEI